MLTNPEVIAIDQDPLGQQGKPVVKKGDIQIWVRELADGAKAIGIFNLGYETQKSGKIQPEKLGLGGEWMLRDCWTHKNLGRFNGEFNQPIRGHGYLLLKAIPVSSSQVSKVD